MGFHISEQHWDICNDTMSLEKYISSQHLNYILLYIFSKLIFSLRVGKQGQEVY